MQSRESPLRPQPPEGGAWARVALPLVIGTAAFTFALLLLGSTVHVTGSSLACPDWPLCHGQVMPPMRGGIAIEHSHRLLATSVGVLSIAIVAVLFRLRSRSRWLALGALGLVVVQGVLGGLTVLLRLPVAISIAHLATSMLFFCVLIWLGARVRRERGGTGPAPQTRALAPSLRVLVGATAAVVWLQMILGALVRHTGAAMACNTSFPLCRTFGWPTLWPEEGPARLHMAHRFGAVLVTVLVVAASIVVVRVARRAGDRALLVAPVAPIVLVAVQVVLGALNVLSFDAEAVAVLHLGVGALLLGSVVLLLFAVASRTRPVEPAASRSLPSASVEIAG